MLALSLAVVHCTVVFHLAGWTSGAKRTDFSSDTRSLAPRVELLPTQPRWGFRVKVQGCKAQGNGFVVRVLGLRTVIGLGILVLVSRCSVQGLGLRVKGLGFRV